MSYSNRFLFLTFSVCCLFIFSNVSAQLSVTPSQPASTLAATLAGPGVTILSPTLTCPALANGTFTATGTLLAMSGGIVLTNGRSSACVGPYGPPPGTASYNDGAPGDPAMASFLPPGTNTYDACILQFDVVASGDSIGFNYQFGSQEYYNAVCGVYSDVFAFFISGPGIVGTPNIALVPGTNIPVEVNSVNDGVPGTESGDAIGNCTSLGPGSPFTTYYINNIGGTQLSYTGYTTKFRAVHAVNPCDTYHLKLSIVDAGNALYDSGVFLEAASLSSNTYVFNHADAVGATINGIPHTSVKGCNPTSVTIVAAHPNPTATTLNLSFGGTAVNGIDVATIPGSITLPAGSDSVAINIQAIPTAPGGSKIFTIYLQGPCGISDSISMNILDTPSAFILTPDTSICPGQSFQVRVSGTPGLTYYWAPSTSLSSTTAMQPVVTPTATTSYTMIATLPGSGCPPDTSSFAVSVTGVAVAILTPDTSICVGQSVPIRVSGGDSLSYSWSPAIGLDSANVKDPIATPSVTTTYVVSVSSRSGCTSSASITISIVTVAVTVLTPDTAICNGASIQVIANGPASASYQWLPTAGIPNANIIDPIITPDTSATYYLISNVPGCTGFTDSIRIDVQPYPNVYIGGNKAVCKFDTLHINASVTPQWYTHYIYSWSPASGLDNTNSSTVIFTAGDSTDLVLTVTTSAGCTGIDSAQLIVHSSDFVSVRDTSLCPGDSIQLKPSSTESNLSYHWHPGMYLSDSTTAEPWANAITTQTYWAIAANQYGCRDTLHVTVFVHSNAVIYLGDSVTLYPGETYQITPQTNCTSFLWSPPGGLSDPYVPNPIASPEISTKYIVHGTTASGCSTTDSINIYVDPGAIIALPNAFTPGNGPNSLLKILKRGIVSLNYFRIYNRWGNLVYDSNNIDAGWDGTFHGVPQPFGVFVYELEALTNTGVVFTKHGNVTLIR